MKLHLEQPINGESSAYLLRSKLRAVSRRMGFAEVKREHMELVINELVTNQTKYANGLGLIQLWEQPGDTPYLHIFALDRGPGIANLPNALEDGVTSGGTLGKGLGTIQRVSDRCDFYTLPDGVAPHALWHGTAVWARFRVGSAQPARAYQVGEYIRAYHDNVHNGDVLCVDQGEHDHVRWLHMDGLGHGEDAAVAVQGSCSIFETAGNPQDCLEKLSVSLKGSRGSVAIACELDFERGTGELCGVGDMSAWFIGNTQKRAIPFSPGVLGHSHGSLETHNIDIPSHGLVLTASDGIRKSWEYTSFPGLWRTHPQLIAFFLGETVGRNNDDRSLLVIREHTLGEEDV